MVLFHPRQCFQKIASLRCQNFTTLRSNKRQPSTDACHTHQLPKLEHLPPEIILMIFGFVSSIPDLKSLVHASPWAHRCYLAERRSVLTEVLIRELPPQILLTLVACIKAPNVTSPGISASVYKEFMDRYPWYLDQFSENAQTVLETEIVAATRLHDIASACIRDFISFCHQGLLTPTDAIGSFQQLSSTEMYRLLRAFYRLELFGRLFSYHNNLKTRESTPRNDLGWRCYDEIQLFFSVLSPWEAEELRCAFDYTCYRWDATFCGINQKSIASAKSRRPRWPSSKDSKSLISDLGKQVPSSNVSQYPNVAVPFY